MVICALAMMDRFPYIMDDSEYTVSFNEIIFSNDSLPSGKKKKKKKAAALLKV